MCRRIVPILILTLTLCACRSSSSGDHRLGSIVNQNVYPNPFWLVAAWAIDPANTSTCASDNNVCQTTTCGAAGSGIGPCSSFHEIARRWGTLTPIIAQNVTITLMSSQPDSTDPIVLTPILSNNGATDIDVKFVCTLPTPTARTITVVTTKARASNALWIVSGINHGTESNLLNDTTNSSWFWHWKTSGLNDKISQPVLTGATDWGSTTFPTEVTIANNDAAQEYTDSALVKATLAEIDPRPASTSSNVASYVEVTHCNGWGRTQDGDTQARIGAYVWLHDTLFTRRVVWTGGNVNNVSASWSNVYFQGGLDGGLEFADPNGLNLFTIWGGVITSGANNRSTVRGSILSGDVICGDRAAGSGQTAIGGSTTIDAAYADAQFTVLDGIARFQSTSSLGGPFFWGTGVLDTATLATYPAGAGKAAATFLTSGGLALLGQTKAITETPGSATPDVGNVTLTAAQLDTSLGTTSGCLRVAQASFCNIGP